MNAKPEVNFRIAAGLQGASSKRLSDEELFQAARRIVIAEWQNMVYKEYVPLVIGSQKANQNNLNVDQSSTYDPNTGNPILKL